MAWRFRARSVAPGGSGSGFCTTATARRWRSRGAPNRPSSSPTRPGRCCRWCRPAASPTRSPSRWRLDRWTSKLCRARGLDGPARRRLAARLTLVSSLLPVFLMVAVAVVAVRRRSAPAGCAPGHGAVDRTLSAGRAALPSVTSAVAPFIVTVWLAASYVPPDDLHARVGEDRQLHLRCLGRTRR